MKYFKLLLILPAMMIAMASFSQTAATMTASKATLSNGDTSYHVTVVNVPCDKITIQANITKNSGTITGGNCLPQGSLDGVNYVNLSTDTLKLASITAATKIWTFDKRQYLYYRVFFMPTGTETSTPQALILTTGLTRY